MADDMKRFEHLNIEVYFRPWSDEELIDQRAIMLAMPIHEAALWAWHTRAETVNTHPMPSSLEEQEALLERLNITELDFQLFGMYALGLYDDDAIEASRAAGRAQNKNDEWGAELQAAVSQMTEHDYLERMTATCEAIEALGPLDWYRRTIRWTASPEREGELLALAIRYAASLG